MHALVKVPAPIEGEEENQIQESRVLVVPDPCCLGKIRARAEPLGISCQQVFERAYLHAGHNATFARAVFAMFLELKGLGPIPLPVQAYLERISGTIQVNGGGKSGFCAGCMLDQSGVAGFVAAYDLIQRVTVKEANTQGTGGLSSTDKEYLDLLDSGALIQENEDWQAFKDMDFPDPDAFET